MTRKKNSRTIYDLVLKPSPFWGATFSGCAMGFVVGMGALMSAEIPLFTLPLGIQDLIYDKILKFSSFFFLPLDKPSIMLFFHSIFGLIFGCIVGILIRYLPLRRYGKLLRPATISMFFSLFLGVLLFYLWNRREVAAGVKEISIITSGTMLLSVIVSETLTFLTGFSFKFLNWLQLIVISTVLLALFLFVMKENKPYVKISEDFAQSQSPHPVVLIGIDAASWSNLDPYVERGLLPTIASMKNKGSFGRLQSLVPTLSPIIWTTMVTGVEKERHGIKDFVIDTVPVTSNCRTTYALWEILPKYKMKSAFVYWWASWPAEKLPGLIVSDRLEKDTLSDRVFPPSHLNHYTNIVDHAQKRVPTLPQFLEIPKNTYDSSFQSRHIGKLKILDEFLRRDEIVTSIGEESLKSENFALYGIYLRLLDAVGHKYWVWHHHDRSPSFARWMYGPADKDQKILGPVIKRASVYTDTLLERLRSAAPSNSNFVIVSDHGMRATIPPKGSRKEAETGTHDISGMILMMGPDINENYVIKNASVYDVFPTILYLLNLPIRDDLPGRVLVEAVKDSTLNERPIQTISDYGPRKKVDSTPIKTITDDATLEQLKALGYIVD